MTAAVILGCAGTELTAEERAFYRDVDPLGFILFARNVADPDQMRRLTGDLRAAVGRDDAPILIDQEGGRVARLKPPHWRAMPPAARFGEIAMIDRARAASAVRINHELLAGELRAIGIDVDCTPVLDLKRPETTTAIGDRAFAADPHLVADLGRAAAEGLMAGGVIPVIKHIPGHGRATLDSHLDLPRIDAEFDSLVDSDFVPFRKLNDLPWGITAHLVYAAIDPEKPATLSARVINEVIRGEIGFTGLLISDDMSMKALQGSLDRLAAELVAAGCDVALHCNGKLDEMRLVAAGCGSLSPAARLRYERGRQRVNREPEFDVQELAEELAELMV
ncbi:MAG TPA: beta-N-acetylhexosaminidase [Candidatus Binatia bacterium]|nr:beta-N-acetylhexosaminidase [Candidatus Binatia bacterium]